MAIEIKQVNSLQTELDSKADVSDVPQTGSENITLTVSQTTLSPTGKPTINLYRAPASIPGDVTFLANYSTGIDADFAVGSPTGTIDAGSPTVGGGLLDLTGNTAQAVSYQRNGNFPDYGNTSQITVRVLIKMPDTIPTSATRIVWDLPSPANCTNENRNRIAGQMYSNGTSNIGFGIVFYSSTQVLNLTVSTGNTIPFVAGKTYEVEWNTTNNVTDEHVIFVDGVNSASSTANPGMNNVFNPSFNNIFYIGADAGGTSCTGQAGRTSDFYIDGVAIFNTAQHTIAGGNYSPVGLPGAGVTTELIDTITATNYADGAEITVTTPEFEGYEFVRTANPSAGQLLLNDTDFDPTDARGFLTLRKYSGYWLEVQRSPSVTVEVDPDPNEISKTYTCTVTEVVGDLVYLSATDTVAQADASAIGTARVIGHIISKPTSTTCKVSIGPGPVTASGLTVGAPVYLSDTAGAVSATEGTIIVEVGIADTTTSFVFTGYKIVG